MKIPNQENNPQSFANETQSTRENTAYAEFTNPHERFISQENAPPLELPEPNQLYQTDQGTNRKKTNENGKNIKILSQHVATVMVGVVAGATTLGIITIVDAVKLDVSARNVSFNTYALVCDLENPQSLGLDFTVTEKNGNVADVVTVDRGWENKTVTLDNLYPETSYLLTVTDEQGKKYHQEEFTTEPIAIFSPNEQNERLLNFALHEDFSYIGDMSISLFSSDGREFSSNVIFSLQEQSLLCLDGLYADDYVFSLTYYPPPPDYVEDNTANDNSVTNDWENVEQVTYEKTISLGNLQTLTFTSQIEAGTTDTPQLILNYIEGTIEPYNQFSITLSNDDGAWHNIDQTLVRQDGNNLYAELPTDIVNGRYQLSLWGQFENDVNIFYNEIFRAEITINI